MRFYWGILLLLIGSLPSGAQEVFFSQYYSSPLYLNPSLTGSTDYSYRAGFNHRNQWNAVNFPFTSNSAYIDGKIYVPTVLAQSWFGMGLMALSDRTGSAGFKSEQMMVAFSHNHQIAPRLFIGIGGGIGIVNKSIDPQNMNWEDEWAGEGFIDGSRDPLHRNSFFYLDASLGINLTYYLMYSHRKRRRGDNFSRIYGGMSIFHLNDNVNTFFDYGNQFESGYLARKYIFHGGYFGRVTDGFFAKPELIYIRAGDRRQLQFGANFAMMSGFDYIMAGIWTRFGNNVFYSNTEEESGKIASSLSLHDFVPMIGWEHKKMRVMMTYDTNVGAVGDFSNFQGGFEFSLTLYINHDNNQEVKKNIRRRRYHLKKSRCRFDFELPKL